MRCAVVGHVEWVEFAPVEEMPAAGQIAHAGPSWQEAGGGGACFMFTSTLTLTGGLGIAS